MSNPRLIRQNLRTRLESISGLQVYDRWPNSIPNMPCAILMPPRSEPEQTFGRGDLTRWNIEVYVFHALTPGYEQANDLLDPLLATSSTGGIYGAIHADRTLGGAVDWTSIKDHRDYGQFEQQEGVGYWGAIVDLEVWSR